MRSETLGERRARDRKREERRARRRLPLELPEPPAPCAPRDVNIEVDDVDGALAELRRQYPLYNARKTKGKKGSVTITVHAGSDAEGRRKAIYALRRLFERR